MEHPPVELPEILRRCGGNAALARELKLSRAAISLWDRVPDKHVETVAKLARLHPAQIRDDLDWVNVDGKFYVRPSEAA